MIKRIMISALLMILIAAALAFTWFAGIWEHNGLGKSQVQSVFRAQSSAFDGEHTPWLFPFCQPLILPNGALKNVDDTASAQEVVSYAVLSLSNCECQCDDAFDLAAMFIEDAIRRGTTLHAPDNGVFYADMLQISANMAQIISGSALGILADADINLARPLRTTINFVSYEGVLDINFPDDISGIDFDNIAVETGFATITLDREFVSGSALRIERGTPVASGGYAYTAALTVAYGSFFIGYVLDFWAVGVVVIIMIVWGALASAGKKLRLWGVPVLVVISIFANVRTLELNQGRPDNVIYASTPVYFYSVEVTMPPNMSATLSIPLGGANPGMLMLVNGQGELMQSRYNPLTDTIDAIIYTCGIYSLQEMDIYDRSHLSMR